MASLTAKIIKGHTYYYARVCKRVDGKPKIVKQIYLGSLHAIIAAVEGSKEPPKPRSVDIATFGDVVALYDLAERIGLVSLIDAHVPKREQGLSVGQYIVLAAINRATHPTSKEQFADWFSQTALARMLPLPKRALSSQAFWNHMDRIDEKKIEAIEKSLSQKVVRDFDISLKSLTYDGTNFFTYINTRNPAEIPQRGHNKQKRNDLRQVSLGMLVSTDFHIPLFHKIYGGNIHDSTIFKSISEELRQRYVDLAQGCDHITLIFDKGNNSKEAFQNLDNSDFHFIGSLTASHHEDLLEIPLRRFQPLEGDRLKDVRAYRTKKVVFKQQRTVVVTHNDNLLAGQLQGVVSNLKKARSKLRDLQTRLRRRKEGRVTAGKAPTYASVENQVKQILKAEFMSKLIQYKVSKRGKVPMLIFWTDTQALAHLTKTQLGKTILFTDNHDWSNEEIILGYRSQYQIESAFRQMKDPHFLRWSPMHHWTDSKIRVHAFYCVLALTLSSLLQRTLYRQGFDWSIPRILKTLGGVKEVLVLYPPKKGDKKPRSVHTHSTLSSDQETLFNVLQLKRYFPE